MGTLTAAAVIILAWAAACDAREVPQVSVDDNGTVHLPPIDLPPSPFMSDGAKRGFLAFVHGFASLESNTDKVDTISAARKFLDDRLMRPGVARLRTVFSVDIRPEMMDGIPTDVVVPIGGIPEINRRRVLINLHGGAFTMGAGLGGQMESIPIASLGAIKVVTVDYREGPEHRFPAASEDVSAVYRGLLRTYPAQNIGIYGCSAGGALAAESVAWFQTHNLPRPGAIGMFSGGAVISLKGDSSHIGSAMMGWQIPPTDDAKAVISYFDVAGLDLTNPLVSPVYSQPVLAKFPPSLLISGTRDHWLSATVYTHSELIKAGVPADLHIWEGATHCSFAQPIVDPSVPETREAWNVIIKFFDRYLGR